MSADTFSSFGCPAARCTPVPDRLRRCPAVQPAAVAVFARRHLPRRTGGQLCAHRTGKPARRVPACRRECPARTVQPAARAPARRRHGAPAPRGRTVYTPAERDCGRVRSRPPCGRRPPVEVGIWRVAVSRWIDGRRFLWTRITAGANIVRPQTVRFYAVREHTVLPYGINCAKSLNSERRGRTAWHLFLRRCRTSPCRSLRYTFHNAI